MKTNFILLIFLMTSSALLFSCGDKNESCEKDACCVPATDEDRLAIAGLLDSLNTAAAGADYNTYFSFYTDDAIFIGTDATENWNKQEFMEWSKPFFDKGKAWNFKSLERNIYFHGTGDLAWFDELLDTQMKICRGSGVVVKNDGKWKIQQYVLSMTIPNSLVDSIVAIKSVEEDSLMNSIRVNP